MEDDEVNGAFNARLTFSVAFDVSERDLLHEIRITLRPRRGTQQRTEAQQQTEEQQQTEAEQPTVISPQNGNITLKQKSRVTENVKKMEAMTMATKVDKAAKPMPKITSTETETTTTVDTSTEKVVCGDKEVEKCGYEFQETAVRAVPRDKEEDISMLPTQKVHRPKRLRMGSQESDKENEMNVSKRRRGSKPGLRGESATESQENIQDNVPTSIVQEPVIEECTGVEVPRPVQVEVEERIVSQVLRDSGIPDNRDPPDPVGNEIRVMSSRPGRDVESESETPLGSLDRTAVDLGSDVTTESNRKLKNEWGVYGTLIKVLKLERRLNRPFTFDELISSGPIIQGKKAIAAASCFSSLLKLKQHGLVIITKKYPSLEIDKIRCGQKALAILNN